MVYILRQIFAGVPPGIARADASCESYGRGSSFPLGPNGGFWLDNFSKKFSLGFHILFKLCLVVAAKCGAETTDDRSGIAYALAHRFRGRYI